MSICDCPSQSGGRSRHTDAVMQATSRDVYLNIRPLAAAIAAANGVVFEQCDRLVLSSRLVAFSNYLCRGVPATREVAEGDR